jgi:transcriptional regulator with XRE-family HTH domain
MPSKPLAVSPAVAQLLRDRRRALGLTLRGVEDLSRESGDPIPHSTLARIELGRFDPGVRRLRQLLDLYQLPIQAAGDILDVEALAGATPIERDPVKLRDRAFEAWKQGKIGEALATFLAFRRRVPNDESHRSMRHEAVLAFAVLTGSLGRLHLSRHMLDELLLDNPEPRVLVPVLIQESVVWRSLGSPVVALAFVDSAAAHTSADNPKQQGWVQHTRAMIHIEQRQFAAAAKCLALAVKLHRRAKSPHDEALAMLAMTRINFEAGRADAALAAARIAERFATKHGFNRIRVSALIDQARALTATGSPDAGKTILRGVLGDPLVADDNATRFQAHYHLWLAERESGNVARAPMELREAAYYLKYVAPNSAEARAVRQELGPVPRESDASVAKRAGRTRPQTARPPRPVSKSRKR